MIVRARGGANIEVRDVTLGAMITASGGTLRGASGVSVTEKEVAGLPAVKQALRIASEAIAKHRLRVWRGQDADRRRVTTTWQARFFDGQPNEYQSWFQIWEWTEASLTGRSNAFWLKEFDSAGRVIAIYFLHPGDVRCRWSRQNGRVEYSYRKDDGKHSDWVTSREVLHFRVGFPAPGALVAPSPLDEHRRAWASALARSQSEENVYTKGQAKAVAVVFPEDVTPEQGEEWKRLYLGDGGVESGSSVKVFGGNPRIETIGLSASDMQFIESQAFSVYDVGRIYGVPPSLLWAAIAGNDKPLTPEHEEDRWTRYGLSGRRMRIETTIGHDASFFGVGARDEPGFAFEPVRGDVSTESEMLVREVQAGILLPDEARAIRGRPPLPNGQGQIPQITPVGGAPNENPSPAPETDEDDEEDRTMRRRSRADVVVPEVRVEFPEIRLEPRIEVTQPEIRIEVPPAEVRVEVPPSPAPEVRVEVAAPEVVVPDVVVNVEPTPVHVSNTVEVVTPERKVAVERDARGFIKGATISDADS